MGNRTDYCKFIYIIFLLSNHFYERYVFRQFGHFCTKRTVPARPRTHLWSEHCSTLGQSEAGGCLFFWKTLTHVLIHVAYKMCTTTVKQYVIGFHTECDVVVDFHSNKFASKQAHSNFGLDRLPGRASKQICLLEKFPSVCSSIAYWSPNPLYKHVQLENNRSGARYHFQAALYGMSQWCQGGGGADRALSAPSGCWYPWVLTPDNMASLSDLLQGKNKEIASFFCASYSVLICSDHVSVL